MSIMKVILKEDVGNLGEAGDVKTVKRGYARNFLFPNNLAADYSKQNRKELEEKKEFYENKKLEKKNNASALKEKLEQEKLSITVAAGEKGRLFGTVTNNDISTKLKELNYNIEKKQIIIKDHIKFSGKYKIKIHLYQDIYAEIEIEVIGKIEKPKTLKKPMRKGRRRYNQQNAEENNEQNIDVAEPTVETETAAVEEEKKETPEDSNNEEADKE